jgi:plasmid stabilization system protein ParE
MVDKIIWSPLSKDDVANILFYLEVEWGIKVANRFLEILDMIIQQIAKNPKQFPVIYHRKNVRKCVITKHNTLYYRYKSNRVDILRIFDTRQNPDKLNLE